MIGIGPKDKWQHDMEKLSRHALIEMVSYLTFFDADRDRLSRLVADSKIFGRSRSLDDRFQRYLANPDKALDNYIRRKKAAKKAAKRKKRSRA